jgi:hypothetical protein
MPPVLVERTVWKKHRPANATRRSSDLTPEEQANAKAALRVLRVRHGTAAKLAVALQATEATVTACLARRAPVSAGLALRVARLAGVHLEDVLSGAWPKAGSCPMCGRCG